MSFALGLGNLLKGAYSALAQAPDDKITRELDQAYESDKDHNDDRHDLGVETLIPVADRHVAEPA